MSTPFQGEGKGVGRGQPGDSVPAEAVITTAELERRPARRPDYRAESRAMAMLTRTMASAEGVAGADRALQQLVDTLLELCHAHSAGVSILTDESGEEVFRWRAVAGAWSKFLGGSMPRDASPCGTVVERAEPLLLSHPEYRYRYDPDAPPIHEALLQPFYFKGQPVGTVWVIAHDESRRFDREDLRLLGSLSGLAAAAYQLLAAEEVRKQAVQELREANQRKDEFLATLSHELRNPLTPVRNAVAVLRLTKLPTPQLRWALNVIDRQTRRMMRMIDDLLDLSRITIGKFELRRERTELARIIEAAVETSRPRIDESGQTLTVTFPAGAVHLDADPIRLAQVLANLLNNAAKFGQRGGRISLTAERRDDELTIAVKDTGIGIAADALPKVCDLFAQAGEAIEQRRGGLGIGLSLVKRLVDMHGGTVEARSEGIGRGAEFLVRLPVLAEPAAELDAPAGPLPAAGTAPQRRILVVDDDRAVVDSTALLLEVLGHEVQTAYDGDEAIAAAEQFRPDVVLLDIGMPKMNGCDVARRIRAQPWGRSMMLIAVTGWGQERDRQLSQQAGFDGHVVKPVDSTQLMELLAQPRPAVS